MPEEIEDERRIRSKIISKVRILVEWSIGGLKQTFRILGTKLAGDSASRETILEVCFKLWNLRVRCMGISEARTVFSAGAEREMDVVPHDEGSMFFTAATHD